MPVAGEGITAMIDDKDDKWVDPWNMDAKAKWPPISESPNGEPSEEHLKLIEEAFIAAEEKITAERGDKPLLVYFGIGVGNPNSTFKTLNNNSPELKEEDCAWQVNPPFLADAAKNGWYVVALSFNHGELPVKGFGEGACICTCKPHSRSACGISQMTCSSCSGKLAARRLCSSSSMPSAASTTRASATCCPRSRTAKCYIQGYLAEKECVIKVVFIVQKFAWDHGKRPLVLQDIAPPGYLQKLTQKK